MKIKKDSNPVSGFFFTGLFTERQLCNPYIKQEICRAELVLSVNDLVGNSTNIKLAYNPQEFIRQLEALHTEFYNP